MENLRIIVDSFLTLISNLSIRNTIDSTFKINSEFDHYKTCVISMVPPYFKLVPCTEY